MDWKSGGWDRGEGECLYVVGCSSERGDNATYHTCIHLGTRVVANVSDDDSRFA